MEEGVRMIKYGESIWVMGMGLGVHRDDSLHSIKG